MRIIPAIDVIDGKCVRLTQGDYAQQRIYNEDPAEVARRFEDAGLKYLHLVDLDGAKQRRVVNWKVVERIASQTRLRVDFGGGVNEVEDLQRLFGLGVAQVNVGSLAVKRPDVVKQWIAEFADRIILSADVRDERVRIHGWTDDASLELNDFLESYVDAGIQYVACTDISTDGMLAGPNRQLYQNIRAAFPSVRLIASGGVGTIDDLNALNDLGVDGVIVGKAIYENKITPEQLSSYGTP